MSCPYFREGYFGICVCAEAIHVPSIDEMERFCFRSWYGACPNIISTKRAANSENVPPKERHNDSGVKDPALRVL